MSFLSPLEMEGVRGKRGIILTATLSFFSDRYQVAIEAPAGTYSNFGSIIGLIPPIIVPRVGKLKDAFVLHDYLYATLGEGGRYSRLQADLILYDALLELGVAHWRAALVLAGVRLNLYSEYKWRTQ